MQLTGTSASKKATIQPAPVFDGTIIRGTGALQPDSIMASLQIIN